jgi:hypothetical protein
MDQANSESGFKQQGIAREQQQLVSAGGGL